MPTAIEQTLQALQIMVQTVPVGTNLALIHLMWSILNGSFLESRGAIFPALQESGFSVKEIRRSWHSMRYGDWSIDDLLQSWRNKVKRYVVRLASNCTARRNDLPEYSGRGRRPQYGQLIRPLNRQRKGKTLAATRPDFETSFKLDGRTIRAHNWSNLMLSELKVDRSVETFSIWVFFDPLYTNPLVLGTNLSLQPWSIFGLYQDRWPVEQVPLVAKQMLGLHRQFVFAPESCQRLPELAMLVGNLLSYLALVLPPMPTGFWDRCPKKTTGRLRRRLARAHFPKVALNHRQIRKKNSVTAHLPKGIAAHRRQKQTASVPPLAS